MVIPIQKNVIRLAEYQIVIMKMSVEKSESDTTIEKTSNIIPIVEYNLDDAMINHKWC